MPSNAAPSSFASIAGPLTPSKPALSLFDLSERLAVVTGGNRGIGAACALALAEAGADLILLQRDVKDTKTRRSIEATGRRCAQLQLDLFDMDRVRAIWEDVEAAAQRLGHSGIDILVQAAGIQRRSPAATFSENDWDDVLNVNLKAVWLLSQQAGRHMLERKRGRIILFASLLTFQGGLTIPAYASSKGAVGQLTMALSNEWSKHGVTVNAIAPGYVKTEMNEALLKDKERLAQLDARMPIGRWAEPEDFKGPLVFLASDASAYVTGTILAVDGGWLGR